MPLLDTNFNQMFQEALEKELKKVTWLNVNNIIFNHDLAENQKQSDYKSSNADADAVMFVNASYSLSADFSKLTARAHTSLMPKKDSLKAFSEKPNSKKARFNKWHIDNNIYRDNLYVQKAFKGAVKDNEDNAITRFRSF